MAGPIIGFVLIIYAMIHGSYANPLWKYQSSTWQYANGFWRALIGLPAWAAAIMLLIGYYKGVLTAVAITIACMLIPVMKMSRDGVAKFKTVMLLLWASMGAYARVFLYLTVFGIPICNWTRRAAEVGWETTAEEFMTRARNTPSGPSFSEIFSSDSSVPEEPSYREPEVEVYKEQADGSKKKMRTNSDNSMYWDPDEEEWKPIRK